MLQPMRVWLVAVLGVVMCASCKKSPMGRVEEIRDQLERDSPRLSDSLAKCGDRASCAKDVAASIGGAFDDKKPDQISAAAVAVVVARDRHATDAGAPDVWLAAMRKAKGPGADALRLATALAMRNVSSKHARAVDTDDGARAFMADVAASIPGACKTYDTLGAGADPSTMPPADSPDHSACVQRDLGRKDGPGGTYGQGLFRGAAGALALWKEALAALHEGEAQTDAGAKDALARRLSALDADTPKIVLKVVAAPAGNTWGQMIQEHETPLGSDAGAKRP
jgi:hypothetical protein